MLSIVSLGFLTNYFNPQKNAKRDIVECLLVIRIIKSI